MSEKKTCFVVMGFGKKTDYATGRVLDLDKSFENIIKPAVEDADLECIRADSIIHSGTIDKPMFRYLLDADVVIADISTLNPNALYELGVRHALKPFTTVVISEEQTAVKDRLPFDISHILIRTYKHLGEDIGASEARQKTKELTAALKTLAANASYDSPVYEFLTNLRISQLETATTTAQAAPSEKGKPGGGDSQTVSRMMERVKAAFAKEDFMKAAMLLEEIVDMMPGEPYYVQQWALATYKSKKPSPMEALENARDILRQLNPEMSTDAETLGIRGAIHKRMYELGGDPANLETALRSYEKGFYLKNDYYNGINLAFLFNVRGSQSSPDDKIADYVLAERTRRAVIPLCEQELASEAAPNDPYWILATLAEAWYGLGENAQGQKYLDQAFGLKPEPESWKKDSTLGQLQNLKDLLAQSPLRKGGEGQVAATPR